MHQLSKSSACFLAAKRPFFAYDGFYAQYFLLSNSFFRLLDVSVLGSFSEDLSSFFLSYAASSFSFSPSLVARPSAALLRFTRFTHRAKDSVTKEDLRND